MRLLATLVAASLLSCCVGVDLRAALRAFQSQPGHDALPPAYQHYIQALTEGAPLPKVRPLYDAGGHDDDADADDDADVQANQVGDGWEDEDEAQDKTLKILEGEDLKSLPVIAQLYGIAASTTLYVVAIVGYVYLIILTGTEAVLQKKMVTQMRNVTTTIEEIANRL